MWEHNNLLLSLDLVRYFYSREPFVEKQHFSRPFKVDEYFYKQLSTTLTIFCSLFSCRGQKWIAVQMVIGDLSEEQEGQGGGHLCINNDYLFYFQKKGFENRAVKMTLVHQCCKIVVENAQIVLNTNGVKRVSTFIFLWRSSFKHFFSFTSLLFLIKSIFLIFCIIAAALT